MAHPQELETRFWSRVLRGAPDECWEWRGTSARDGRGIMSVGNKTRTAPRIAWLLNYGVWPPEEAHVCHRCDNAKCCNPAHLWLGTQAENIQDCREKGRFRKWPVRREATRLPPGASAVLYEGEPWHPVRLRRAAACALSGAPLRSGDLAYRPSHDRQVASGALA